MDNNYLEENPWGGDDMSYAEKQRALYKIYAFMVLVVGLMFLFMGIHLTLIESVVVTEVEGTTKSYTISCQPPQDATEITDTKKLYSSEALTKTTEEEPPESEIYVYYNVPLSDDTVINLRFFILGCGSVFVKCNDKTIMYDFTKTLNSFIKNQVCSDADITINQYSVTRIQGNANVIAMDQAQVIQGDNNITAKDSTSIISGSGNNVASEQSGVCTEDFSTTKRLQGKTSFVKTVCTNVFSNWIYAVLIGIIGFFYLKLIPGGY